LADGPRLRLPRDRRRFPLGRVVLLIVLGTAACAAPAGAQSTTYALAQLGTNPSAAHPWVLLKINSRGERVGIVTHFDSLLQGPTGQPFDLVVAPNGNILVTVFNVPASTEGIFVVDPVSGIRSSLSDLNDPAQGPGAPGGGGMTFDAAGDILAVTGGSGSRCFDGLLDCGLLVRVDAHTGARTLITDFGDAAQGRTGVAGLVLAVELGGDILITVDQSAGLGTGISWGELLRIDPHTGARTLISDFRDTSRGVVVTSFSSSVMEATGTLLITDTFHHGSNGAGDDGGRVVRVDSAGIRTVVAEPSVSSYSLERGISVTTFGGTILQSGLIADSSALRHPAILLIDPSNGSISVFSDGLNPAQGVDLWAFGPVAFTLDPPQPGDILTFGSGGTNGFGQLLRVFPQAGQRTVISDMGNPLLGPIPRNGFGLAADTTNGIFNTDIAANVLYQISPFTGARSVVNDFNDPSQGPVGHSAFGVAVEASGDLLVVDRGNPGFTRGRLLRVRKNGQRDQVTDFADASRGPLGRAPNNVAVEPDGTILVTDEGIGGDCRGFGPCGALFRVYPRSGRRQIVSDFGNALQGPFGSRIIDLAADTGGRVLVSDVYAGSCQEGCPALFRVYPDENGRREILSDAGNPGQGDRSYGTGIVRHPSDGILWGGGCFGICFVDDTTGVRTYLSDFRNPGLGPVGGGGSVITFIPSPVITVKLTTASSPPEGGTITPESNTLAGGTTVQVRATANPGYAFAGFSGALGGTTSPQVLNLAADTEVVANFTAVGPRLAASVGVRRNGNPGTRIVPITLFNSGVGNATQPRITSITGITVLTGTGSVTVASPMPFFYPDLLPGQQAPQDIVFNWPSTAVRIRFTVNFAAEGGYTGSTVVTSFY